MKYFVSRKTGKSFLSTGSSLSQTFDHKRNASHRSDFAAQKFGTRTWNKTSRHQLLQSYLLVTLQKHVIIDNIKPRIFPAQKFVTRIWKKKSHHLLSQRYHLLSLHKHGIIDDIKPGIMLETATTTKDPRELPYNKNAVARRIFWSLRGNRTLFWGRGLICFSPLRGTSSRHYINISLSYYFRLNNLKGTSQALAVNRLRLNALSGTETAVLTAKR